jgi:hypothetical protein
MLKNWGKMPNFQNHKKEKKEKESLIDTHGSIQSFQPKCQRRKKL